MAASSSSPSLDGITANHDVLVDDAIIASYPLFEPLLGDVEQAETFRRYDAAARTAKRRYTVTGATSVALAMASMSYQAIGLSWLANGRTTSRWVDGILGAMGLAAIGLVAAAHFMGLRRKWLGNAYVRESMRLWRHQQMLDGALLDLLRTDPAKFREVFQRRWATFAHDALVGASAARAFARGRSPSVLGVVAQPPTDPSIRHQVFELQALLRLRYQLRYATVKNSTGNVRPSPGDLAVATGWVATFSLVAAVTLSACSFVLLLSRSSASTINAITALSLLMAALSAGVRALRSGLTIPFESDSYAEYGDRIRALHEAFEISQDDARKWGILAEAEVCAAQELHRFLAAKFASRFIF